MGELMWQKFFKLINRLSPENLHCDGEISISQAQARQRQIMKEWRELEKEAGQKVSVAEVEAQQTKDANFWKSEFQQSVDRNNAADGY